MAYQSGLLSFLLILCMSSMAHCSLFDLNNIVDRNIIPDLTGIDRVTVSGVVGCKFPPSLRSEPSLPAGTNVALTCDGGRTVISDAVTDTEGFFEITLNTLVTSLFHPNQCDDCRIAIRGTSAAVCGVFLGRRGALLAPINCRHPVVDQPHGHDYEHGEYAVQYKAEHFYYDPSYINY